MKTFPFHKQETEYTCGAACMKMALEFFGEKKSEKQITKLLHTNKNRGTWPKYFSTLAEKLKFSYACIRNSSIEEIKKYQKDGYIVTVLYFYKPGNFDHYAIIKKIDSKYIYFWDPFFGENHKYSLTHFKKIWKNDPRYEKEKNRLFAIKK